MAKQEQEVILEQERKQRQYTHCAKKREGKGKKVTLCLLGYNAVIKGKTLV